MINLQSVFLLVAVFSLGEGQLGNVPQYDELVNMAATRFHSSFVDNFTEPMIDLQSMLKSANYLDNEAQTLGWKYSDNPSLLNIIRHSFILDMCQWLQPNVSIKCCTDLKVFFKSLLLKKMWAIKSKWRCFVFHLIYVYIHPALPPWAGRDTRSIFKQSTAGLNSEYSFS